MLKTDKMDLDTKKDLVSNWFKLLQDAFCNDISILENNKKAIRFNSMFGFKLNVTQEKNKILEYQLNLQSYLASRQKYKRIIN